MIKLSNFYNKTAQYDKSRLLLEILRQKSNKKEISDTLTLKLIDAFGLYFLSIGEKENAMYCFTGSLMLREKTIGTSFDDFSSMSYVFQESQTNVGMVGNEVAVNIFSALFAQRVRLMYMGVLNWMMSDEGKMQLEAHSGGKINSEKLDIAYKILVKTLNKKDMDEAFYKAGKEMVKVFEPFFGYVWGRKFNYIYS